MQWLLWHIIIINKNAKIQTKYHTTFIIMRLCAQKFLIASAIHSNAEKFPAIQWHFVINTILSAMCLLCMVFFLFICWLLLWLEDTHHTVYYRIVFIAIFNKNVFFSHSLSLSVFVTLSIESERCMCHIYEFISLLFYFVG